MNKTDKMCSAAEIEQKRLLALQRRAHAQLKAQNKPISAQMHLQTTHKNSINILKQNKTNNRFNPIEPRNFFSRAPTITGTCYMISNDRFALETSTYIPSIINTIKTIPSRMYDAKSKIWNFHINNYNDLVRKLNIHESQLSLTKIPETVIQIFKKNLNSNLATEIDLSNIDKKLVDSLMPFQREGVCYGLSKGGRCMIADEMGLGKTIQALGIAHYYKASWPLLIVAPSSVKFQWSAAIYDFLPSVPTHYVHHFANTKDYIGDEKITIISYDLLARSVDTIAKHIYGFVILDESHVLKSKKTARFQAVQQICAHARHVMLLTGTPVLSRPIELYSQMSLILPRFMRHEDYGIRYCAGQRNAFGWDFTGSSNMQELQLLLKVTCMIRRLKVDVLNQMPSKIRQVIILDAALIKAGTKQMREKSKLMHKKGTAHEMHNALLQYYTESSHARLKAVRDHITKLFENKRKCLLYAHHQNVLDAICDVAESMNIRYIRIDGRTTSEQRKHQIDIFQECNDCLVAILSLTAANAGITLTAAQLVVFAELFWNPGILCQAEDRVHRIGQNENVTIQYLVAKDTADDYIWPLITKKLNVLSAAGLDHDFSIDDVDITSSSQDSGQRDLNSFINVSPIKEQSDETQENCPSSGDTVASTSASTNEFKKLLEVDEEYFNLCDWNDIM